MLSEPAALGGLDVLLPDVPRGDGGDNVSAIAREVTPMRCFRPDALCALAANAPDAAWGVWT